jgi:hypothetical protein
VRHEGGGGGGEIKSAAICEKRERSDFPLAFSFSLSRRVHNCMRFANTLARRSSGGSFFCSPADSPLIYRAALEAEGRSGLGDFAKTPHASPSTRTSTSNVNFISRRCRLDFFSFLYLFIYFIADFFSARGGQTRAVCVFIFSLSLSHLLSLDGRG